MEKVRLFGITFLFLCLFACKKSENSLSSEPIPDETGQQLPPLQMISAQGKKLITKDGREFRAWGFNYSGPSGPLFIEQYWDTRWADIEKDFDEMKKLGSNCIRMSIQYETFMSSPSTQIQHSLDQLKKVFKLAEAKRMYIVLCGANSFIMERQPQWYVNLSDSARVMTVARYWELIAETIGNSSALLAYDLMNEPVIAVNGENGWTPGESFGGYYFVQNIVRYNPKKDPIDLLMKFWIAIMTNEIRKHDKEHLITVGFLPFTVFAQMSSVLGMSSTHIYPKSGNMQASSDILKAFISDKPLLISETFPLECNVGELQTFITEHNKDVVGWLWHYSGKTIAELEAENTINGAIWAASLKKFKEMAPAQK